MNYSCANCRRFAGLFLVGGTHKVKCRPEGLREIPLPGSCPGWVGEDFLQGWPERAWKTGANWRASHYKLVYPVLDFCWREWSDFLGRSRDPSGWHICRVGRKGSPPGMAGESLIILCVLCPKFQRPKSQRENSWPGQIPVLCVLLP